MYTKLFCFSFFLYFNQTLTGKLVQVLGNMPSSPESSSDSSVGSPHNQYDGPNLEAESALPAVVSIMKILKVTNVDAFVYLSSYLKVSIFKC